MDVRLNRRSLLVGSAASAAVAIAARGLSRSNLGISQFPARTAPDRMVSARTFGALGDGHADDRAAIQSAIDSMAASGGGQVLLPAGLYLVSSAAHSAVAIELKSGVSLRGEGAGSIIKLRDGAGGHTVDATDVSNCAMRSLVIDGNRERQPSVGHGFRSGGVVGLVLQNLTIKNTYHYGIGIEAGINKNIVIDGVAIANTGGDGIDIKNKKNSDSDIVISNVTIRRWGLRTDVKAQTGIDCRGPIRLTNIQVSEPVANDAVGIRMRQGEASDINGIGGHHSNLNSFQVRMGTGHAQIGIDVVARYVTVANGSVTGGSRGLLVEEIGFRGAGIHVAGCSGPGILIDSPTPRLHGDGAILSDCSARDCGQDGFEVDSNDVRIVNCTSSGNRGYGVMIMAGASRAHVQGGSFSGNGAGRIGAREERARIT